jgi:hypothetical protein
MNKKRIRSLRCRAKRPMRTQSILIKKTDGKSDGCAWKAIELISGEQLRATGGRTGNRFPNADLGFLAEPSGARWTGKNCL